MGIAPKRRRRTKAATPINPGERWTQYGEQQRLESMHRTEAQNAADRQACRDLLEHGYGSDLEFITWLELCGQQ